MPDISALDETAIAAIDPAALAQLDDDELDVPALSVAIARVAGARPRLQIDLTDPPCQQVATSAGVGVAAASADEAVRELAMEVASAVQARATELGIEPPGAA